MRPDGTVVVVPSADPDSLQIVDPDRGPLVERSWDVNSDALIGFGAGRAAVVDRSASTQVIDLASGDAVEVTLRAASGDPFVAVGITPEVDGYLAWNDGTAVARWRGDELVEPPLELWTGMQNVSQTVGGALSGNPGFASTVVSPGDAGGGFAGAGAVGVFEDASVKAVYAFDPEPGNLRLFSVNSSPPFSTRAVAPAPGGGLYLALADGELRRYDKTANGLQDFDTGFENPTIAVHDVTTGLVALGGENGAVVVDPASGSVRPVSDAGDVVSIGFARNGSRLVVVASDGTVRLWDTERAEEVGTLWNGNGVAPASPPWYDEATDTIWVATSGKVVQFSLDSERWIERVCGLVSRELTPGEWDRLVPGDAPQRAACS